MDAQAKKALFRAKLKAQKKEKRIDSPLVRYNEFDQPICRVCDLVLKSESQWDAHQASRKHHEAISNMKANAARLKQVDNAKTVPGGELSKSKPVHTAESHLSKSEPSKNSPRPQSSSRLPPDFFDNNVTKKQKTGLDSVNALESDMHLKSSSNTRMDAMPSSNGLPMKSIQHANELAEPETSALVDGSESKDVKRALPEGFFDNKEADLRARGIKPVKVDVKDEYSEFEKLIQEDLKEIDNRLEEEEVDAAETIEEAETFEQKTNRDKVEMLKKKKMEWMAARSAKRSRGVEAAGKESSRKDLSSDDETDENFAVDWRAQHL
ncbi:zinc finger protein [Tripterygium wilfordii]|uniref:Zinc finger protein 830 n=1 Tax=Tripterygium wilfordii TaxID=458696 RepID=A0A7J7CVD0_TRIWF|nr:zinc finger protein 830-like [Tripterygium wilfordii]XP_038718750.1 zinc finger protein 830-like [Tripterygium wilfordii]KAF5737899.1 zinc finger protein [Tripterygium wilfordii]